MLKTILKFFLFSLSIYLLAVVILFMNQRKFIYHPKLTNVYDIEELNISSEKNVNLKVFILNKGQKDAILYFGGNAENVLNNQELFKNRFKNKTIYLLNYRSYGGSTGNPSETAFYHDAIFVYDYIKKSHTEVSIIGRSLGTGVATYVAVKRDISRLILVTPFDSLEAIAKKRFHFMPVKYILLDKYNSVERAPFIKIKTLVFLGSKDELIPYENSLNLIDNLKRVDVKIFNKGHNDIQEDERYIDYMEEYIDKPKGLVIPR